jgi:glucose-6-phosphate dehydrogenase assembly protein OpcA
MEAAVSPSAGPADRADRRGGRPVGEAGAQPGARWPGGEDPSSADRPEAPAGEKAERAGGQHQPQVVKSWSGQRTSLGEVLAALPSLRRQAAGREAGTRTAVMTIVIVSNGGEEAKAALESVRSIGAHHPCRAVLLQPDPDATPAIDASACLWRAEPRSGAGHPVFFEELAIRVGGQAASHLASIVGPFVLADLPVVIWFPTSLPDPADPLLRVASALVVDTRAASGQGDLGHAYRALLDLASSRPVVDLSWVRLQPWRELLAGLFEPEHNRRFLEGARLAAVKGKPGPRFILGGWLMAQLDLRARELQLADARHVEISLSASFDGEEGIFEVKRDEGTRAVWARATFSGGLSHTQALPLPDSSLTNALAGAVSYLRPDRTWERALSAAATLA